MGQPAVPSRNRQTPRAREFLQRRHGGGHTIVPSVTCQNLSSLPTASHPSEFSTSTDTPNHTTPPPPHFLNPFSAPTAFGWPLSSLRRHRLPSGVTCSLSMSVGLALPVTL